MRLESIVLTAVLLVLACASFFLIVNVFELSHTSIALIIFILGLICAKFVFPMMIKAKVNQKNKESNKEAHTTERAKAKTQEYATIQAFGDWGYRSSDTK